MSRLGEFRRLPPALLAEIRVTPEEAYDRVVRLAADLDLDRAWERLSALMDRAGFPIDPIAAGTVFPDDRHAFGRDGDSRTLSADQVAAAAAHLSRTPFAALGAHLRPLLESEQWFLIADPTAPLLEPPEPQPGPRPVDAETERAIRKTLDQAYTDLVDFFTEAAENAECTIFWAA